MTAITARRDSAVPLIGACLLALALRPVGWTASGVTLAVGATGAIAATDAARHVRWHMWIAVTIAGMSAFALVRWTSRASGVRMTVLGIVVSAATAVAEELFFRRLLYSRLERFGAFAAVVVSAALFAAVHVRGYGTAAMPVDFAAGLLLGWQRRATGTWTAPAATHVFANLIQIT